MGRQTDRLVEVFGPWKQLVAGRAAEALPKGSVVYTPDQPADALFLLSGGQLGLYLLAPEGRTLMLRVIEPGQLFGHVALADGDQYDTFAQAQTAARVYRIDRAEVARAIESDPQLALELLDDLGKHRLLVSRLVDEVAFKSVPARLAALLLDLARGNGLEVPRRSHRQLAEMINAYRETVTKVINQFRAARLLEIDRYTITLVNPSGLEDLAQGW